MGSVKEQSVRNIKYPCIIGRTCGTSLLAVLPLGVLDREVLALLGGDLGLALEHVADGLRGNLRVLSVAAKKRNEKSKGGCVGQLPVYTTERKTKQLSLYLAPSQNQPHGKRTTGKSQSLFNPVDRIRSLRPHQKKRSCPLEHWAHKGVHKPPAKRAATGQQQALCPSIRPCQLVIAARRSCFLLAKKTHPTNQQRQPFPPPPNPPVILYVRT